MEFDFVEVHCGKAILLVAAIFLTITPPSIKTNKLGEDESCYLDWIFQVNFFCLNRKDSVRTFWIGYDASQEVRLTTLLEQYDLNINENIKLIVSGHGSFDAKLVAKRPLAYFIKNVISAQDADAIISFAIKNGMKNSLTNRQQTDQSNGITLHDIDLNGRLDIDEMRITLETAFDFYLTKSDILIMFEKLGVDTNHDQLLDRKELQNTSPDTFLQYLQTLHRKDPRKKSRFSRHTWLFPDDAMHMQNFAFSRLTHLIGKMLQLPSILVQSADFQIVHYPSGGHYHAHYDSSDSHKKNPLPCCQRVLPDNTPCRSCRFLTFLIYLNDVTDGGETLFPIADNKSFDETQMLLNNLRHLDTTACSLNHDSSRSKREKSKLLIKPRKGSALLWYNHKLDSQMRWMGEMDKFSIHGGCPVLSGEKWIGNFWIKPNATPPI